MTLKDLPAFAVEEITQASDDLRLRGRFSHLTGVHLGRSYLYCGDAQWPGDLIECDAGTRSSVFTAPLWVRRDLIKVGSVVPWLPTRWQFFHVNMILMSRWERRAFLAADAQHFRQGDVQVGPKSGSHSGAIECPRASKQTVGTMRSAGSATRRLVGADCQTVSQIETTSGCAEPVMSDTGGREIWGSYWPRRMPFFPRVHLPTSYSRLSSFDDDGVAFGLGREPA